MTEDVTALVYCNLTNRNAWISPSHTKLAVQPVKKCVIVMAVRPLSYRGVSLEYRNALTPKFEWHSSLPKEIRDRQNVANKVQRLHHKVVVRVAAGTDGC